MRSDPGVGGRVTIVLDQVPWDQALDIILRSLSLGMVREGNVIRVATSEALDNERRAAIEEANNRVQLKPLETRLVPISYATVDEMIPKVQSVLSPRGTVTPDSRTNTLIIMDVADNIALAEQLVSTLDTQTPQVLIEARIVEARTTFVRQLGIQWGFGGAAAPELGNTLPLTFPNQISGAGLAGAVNDQGADFARLSLGALNGAFRIDAALSALETDGKVEILLRPRVVTQNNIKATITRGEEIPYVTLTAPPATGGITIIQPIPQVQFKTAALNLAVLPRISASGTVILEVDVDNGSRGTVQANGNVAINTQRVQTTVLVKDQGTTVIGGIYETFEAASEDRTPGLSRVPFIGRLFKRNQMNSDEGELLIFITPRILKDGQVAQVSTNPVSGAGK